MARDNVKTGRQKAKGRVGDPKAGVPWAVRGQVAVEYVLLLVVGVAIWLLLVSQLVSRNPESPGLIVKKWYELIQFIGQDRIEP